MTAPPATRIYLILFNSFIIFQQFIIPSHGSHSNTRIQVEKLLFMEREMITLCKYMLNQEVKLHAADSPAITDALTYLEQVKPINDMWIDDLDHVTDDVLHIYHLKKRLFNEWIPVLDTVTGCKCVRKFQTMKSKLTSVYHVIHNDCDLDKAIDDILNLNTIQKVPVATLAVGLSDPEHSSPLTAEELLYIARRIDRSPEEERGDPSQILEWIDQGFLASPNTTSKTWTVLRSLQARIFIELDRLSEATQIYEELLAKDPDNRAYKSNLQYLEQRKEKSGDFKPEAKKKVHPSWHNVCRGEYTMNAREREALVCFTKDVPALPAPVQVEEVHKYPRVYLVKNIFTDKQLERIEENYNEMAWDTLVTDKFYTSGRHTKVMTNIEQSPWMEEYIEVLRNLSFTGATVRPDDALRNIVVWENGPGGSKRDPVNVQNHVMATIYHTLPIVNYALFLNTIEQGGGIAFPRMRLHVPAEKGSMLMWQFKSRHGPVHPAYREYVECPPVFGTQLVAGSTMLHNWVVNRLHIDPRYVVEPVFPPRTEKPAPTEEAEADDEEEEEAVAGDEGHVDEDEGQSDEDEADEDPEEDGDGASADEDDTADEENEQEEIGEEGEEMEEQGEEQEEMEEQQQGEDEEGEEEEGGETDGGDETSTEDGDDGEGGWLW